MKTIIARFEDMKKDPGKALEDGISFNKVEEALSTLGIALRDTTGEFRPLQEVFTELGMQWDSLTRNQQAYIATVAAGSRQQSRFLAMMNNFDRTLELIAESQNSAGAAAKQYATYQDSIAAAQNRLAASWEKFYSKVVDNSVIKLAINSLATLVEALSKVPPAITAIGTAFGALTIQSFLQSKGGLIKIIGNLLGATNEDKQYEAFGIKVVQNFLGGFEKGLSSSNIDEIAKGKITEAINGATTETLKGLGNLSEGAKKTGNAFDILKGRITGAATALWSLITNPVFLAIAAATAIIVALGYAIYKAGQKANDAAKEVEKLNKEINDLNTKSKNRKDLINSYDELIQKTKRTEDEQKQLNNVIDQMSETYENANIYIDEYGNRHLQNVETLRKENKELDENIKKLKLEALAAQEVFLATPGKQWTKENTNQAGLSDDFYSKYEAAVNASANSAAWQNLEANLREDLPDLLNSEADISYTISKIQDLINNSGLDFEVDDASIGSLKTTEEIINTIKNSYIEAYGAAKELNLVQRVIDQELQRINVDKWALNFEVDPKQTGLKSSFIELLKAIPVEQYYNDNFGERLQKSFEDSIKKLTNPKDIMQAQKFIEDAFKGNFNSNEIPKMANEYGAKLSNEFLAGMQLALLQREQQLKQNTIEAVSNIFGGIDVSNNDLFTGEGGMTQKESERIVSHANFIKNNSGFIDSVNEVYLSKLSPIWSEIDKKIEESIENGSTKGLRKSVENFKQEIIDKNGIDSMASSLTINYADQELNTVVDQIINKLETELSSATESLTHYREYLDLDQGQGLTADQYSEVENVLGRISSYYIDINKEGQKFLTAAGKIALIEKQTQTTLEKINKLQNINIEKVNEILHDDKLSLNQKQEQIKYYQRQNQLLEKQKTLYEDINNQAKQITVSTNISIADNYYKDLDVIKQAEKEMTALNGRINRDTREALNQMGAEYVNFVKIQESAEGDIYTLTAENLQNIKDLRMQNYKNEVDLERQSLQRKIDNLDTEINYFENILGNEKQFDEDIQSGIYRQHVDSLNNILSGEEEKSEKTKNNQETEWNNTLKGQADFDNEYLKQHYLMIDQAGAKWNDLYYAMGGDGAVEAYGSDRTAKPIAANQITVKSTVKVDPILEVEEPKNPKDDENQEWVKKYLEKAKAAKAILEDRLKELKVLAPDLEIPSSSGKSADEYAKSLEAIAEAAEDAADALKDLDDLLKDIQRDLKDITVDYNPFTDLFEAWEHEWDYYYNIKRLIAQIGTQGQFIDNIISSDYASADQKLEAEHAKVGNLVSKMAANDAYITALRAGMSQTGVELMKEFGEYYKIDPSTGQIYQTDKNLEPQINKTINERRKEIYDLQKLQNEKENDLNLENAKLDALEQEKSAYESILSTVESQIDSLKNNEDITVDIAGLQNQKAELEAKINVTDESIDSAKEKIKSMEDEIQEINVKITLKDQEASQLENYVDRMEDKVSEYEEYWETLNSTIAEQQELLQQLTEVRNDYIETAISTQRQLYNAIVENYQDEINEKKKQYDYLKQLDQDYLRSIKDNISKERQIREDANKQRSYQQNQQRAQLLQMDTSGAFRSELASLNKEIEGQRQELYDDLVDKQVEALEKEIDKRHELYDKEVSALEERLAYMQENAVLLWESVNAIVADGTDAMMAMLENTTEYINSSELERMNLRDDWEYDVKKTFEGTEEGVIAALNGLVAAGNEFIIDKYPEVGQAIDDYKLVFDDAKTAIDDYTLGIKTGTSTMAETFTNFMTDWNTATHNFTGYAENWSDIINTLIEQTDEHKAELEGYYDEEGVALSDLIGSMGDFDAQIQQVSQQLYDDFIDERRRYQEELNGVIETIQAEITTAIENAADAIQNAANSITFNSPQPSYSGGSGEPTYTPTPTQPDTGSPTKEPDKYKIKVHISGQDTDGEKVGTSRTLDNFSSADAALKAAEEFINNFVLEEKLMAYGYDPLIPIRYKFGGFADFTGPAWLDGTKSQPEAVLNAKQTRLFTSMVSSLEKASNNSNINSALGSSYNIGDINTNINVEKLDNETDIDRVARQVENRIMKSIRNRVSIAVA